MRLASALVPSLLFAASTAWAAPPDSDQGAAAPPHQTQAHAGPSDATSRAGQDVSEPAASREPSPAVKRAAYPRYGPGEQGTEADCYYVFGELRCDRIPSRPPK